MASAVEICNLAMSFLGDSGSIASIDPPDGTTASKMAAIYYPIAKPAMLEMYDWTFATKRTMLPAVSGEYSDGWAGVYQLPADCLRVIDVRPSETDVPRTYPFRFEPLLFAHEESSPFETMGGRVFTDVENPVVRYISSEVHEGAFSPNFTTAFAYYLAMEIAGSRIKGKEGQLLALELSKQFQRALAVAKTCDANQQSKRLHFTPSWILRR